MRRLKGQAGVLLGLAVFVLHSASPVVTSGDSRWTVFQALSFLQRGDLDLDEYQPRLQASGYYAITRPDGHYRTIYPAGTALLAAPAVAGLQAALGAFHFALEPLAARIHSPALAALLRGNLEDSSLLVELLIASLWIALAAVLLYCIALEFTGVGTAVAVALIFAFASPAWSTGSRALGMQAADMLLLSAALLAGIHAARRPAQWTLAGAILSFAFFTRPTNAIPAAVFAVWALRTGRKPLILLIAGALPIAALFAVRNFSIFGALLEPYARPAGAPQGSLGVHASWAKALVGHLVSPARGLFVYAPILLGAMPGFLLWWRIPARRTLAAVLAAIAVLHYLLISSVPIWWGGFCNGPRLFSDILPVFVVLLIPLLDSWKARSLAARTAIAVAIALGVLINGWSACNPGPARWNTIPNDIDYHTERVWDWSDPPFLRGLPGRT
ncbi:MAG: glycosyltransferase family 39 protein [Acidobacteria bacterium]|nr:glycosyltransferase family 39 protein [Acidobacteriota bacterium]